LQEDKKFLIFLFFWVLIWMILSFELLLQGERELFGMKDASVDLGFCWKEEKKVLNSDI